MSVPTRKPHISEYIEVTVHGNVNNTRFVVPRNKSEKLFNFLKSIQSERMEELVAADKVFKNFDKKYGKVGVTIRGLRFRDKLTQKDLATRLNIQQTHISQIENGKRVVGKNLAQKLAKIFETDYRLFL